MKKVILLLLVISLNIFALQGYTEPNDAAKLQAMGKKITPAQLQEWAKYNKLKEESLRAIAAAQKAKDEPDRTKKKMLYEADNLSNSLSKLTDELWVFWGTFPYSNELKEEVGKLYDQVNEAWVDYAWEFPSQSQIPRGFAGPDNLINISGLDKKKVLQALFKRAQVQRFKKALYAIIPGADTLNDEEAQKILEKKGGKVGYIKGRSIKVDFNENPIDTRDYDSANGGQGVGYYAIEDLKSGNF